MEVKFKDRKDAGKKLAVPLENEVHEIVCASTPSPFYGVGLWYQDFSQTTDEEVRTLLQEV